MARKVAVAMSGGVDSSVAAALLADSGNEVFGLTLRLSSCEGEEAGTAGRPCCSARDVEDARAAAARLGIPHHILDAREEFRRAVVEPFAAAYAAGRTPVPCAACNAAVKFGLLLDRALALGADALATGHYARVIAADGRVSLGAGEDRERDQSYFLAMVPGDRLARAVFPLGSMGKDAVRAKARELGLANAGKPDSQELCFVPGDDTGAYLAGVLPDRPGRVVDSSGRALAEHRGVHFFTVGQRRGLGVATGAPLHVTALRPDTAEVVVGPEADLMSAGCEVGALNMIAKEWPAEAVVRIRSRHPGVLARVERTRDGGARALFREPQRSVTPGQLAVFMAGEEVLGGGIIVQPIGREGG
jgi:tRNA-specific 2-thiouridylase